jgi:hypothetical protein
MLAKEDQGKGCSDHGPEVIAKIRRYADDEETRFERQRGHNQSKRKPGLNFRTMAPAYRQ